MKEVKALKNTNSEMSLSLNTYITLVLLYLLIPILIFIGGFIRPLIAIPIIILMALSGLLLIKDCHKQTEVESLMIEKSSLIIAGAICAVTIVVAGVGEFAWSTLDHAVRYATLNDLVNNSWPISFDIKEQYHPELFSFIKSGNSAFIYYFSFWMIPALVGKCLGLFAARIALVLWATIGLFLVYLGICFICRKSSVVLLVFFIIFSGLDLVPYVICTLMGQSIEFEKWNVLIVVFGNYRQLADVFNQCIPAWLIGVLLIKISNNKSIGLLGALLFAYSPWATIGLVPLCVSGLFIKNKYTSTDTNKVSNTIRNILSWNNIIPAVLMLFCFGAFYKSNSNSYVYNGFIWNSFKTVGELIREYLGYLLFEVAIWAVIALPSRRKNYMLITAVVTLIIMPLYRVSAFNDWCRRGTIVPLFVLCVYSIDEVYKSVLELKENKQVLLNRVKVVLLGASAFVAISMSVIAIAITMQFITGDRSNDTSRDIVSFGRIETETYVSTVEPYLSDYEDSFFFKYLAR